VTAPDVLCDPVATIGRSMPMLRNIRTAGYKAALVGLVLRDYLSEERAVYPAMARISSAYPRPACQLP
jgi:hypothetical protein